jgi:hypothetical protein
LSTDPPETYTGVPDKFLSTVKDVGVLTIIFVGLILNTDGFADVICTISPLLRLCGSKEVYSITFTVPAPSGLVDFIAEVSEAIPEKFLVSNVGKLFLGTITLLISDIIKRPNQI